MKKIIVSVFLMNLLMVPALILATGITPTPSSEIAGGIGGNIPQVTSIDETLNTVANYVIGALIVAAVFYIILAGYGFITSNGDPTKTAAARNRILYAGIGVVVALLAKGIVSLVLSAMKGSN